MNNLAEKIDYAPGIYQGIPAAEYHALPLISNSYLKKLAKCPANAKVVDDTETKALILGRAAHVMTLEGAMAFHAEFGVLPEGINLRTNAGKEALATFQAGNANKMILSADDYGVITGIRQSVQTHPFAKALLQEGVSETTVIFDSTSGGHPIRCKCRPDRTPSVDMATLIDLKTTEDASYTAFLRSCVKYGYFTQAAFYVDGYNAVKPEADPAMDTFVFIAVEKKPPFRCEVYTVDQELITWGRGEYQRLLALEAECRRNNLWPHFTNAGADDLLMPSWLK